MITVSGPLDHRPYTPHLLSRSDTSILSIDEVGHHLHTTLLLAADLPS